MRVCTQQVTNDGTLTTWEGYDGARAECAVREVGAASREGCLESVQMMPLSIAFSGVSGLALRSQSTCLELGR